MNKTVCNLSLELSNLLHKIRTKQVTDDVYDNILNYLRSLRFYCSNTSYQNVVRECDNALIISNVAKLLMCLVNIQDVNTKAVTCVTVGLQFMGNFIVNNQENQKLMISDYLELYKCIFASLNLKQQNIVCMIYYNIYISHESFEKEISVNDEMVTYIGEHFDHADYEFALLLLEFILRNANSFGIFYDNLSMDLRLKILEFIEERALNNESHIISKNVVDFFVERLKNFGCEHVFEYLYCISVPFSWEIAKIVSILSLLSKNNDVLDILKRPEFCHYIVELFMKIRSHDECKKTKNLLKKKDVTDNLTNHVSYLFKRNVIQIIANLCWKNYFLKEQYPYLVRMLSQSCEIDENNPFAAEWSIFAIKNMCEVTTNL